MNPRYIRRITLIAAFVSVVSALSGASAGADETPLFDYRQITLDNGLKVITLEDPSCPVVNVQLWYHVGSKDEQAERQGFAHMFEHMMFRGTDLLGPTDHFDFVRRTGGSCNAYTSFDQTVYHETLPANQLELALWLESQRMALLKIDQDSYSTERKVVEEERRLGLNQPFGTVAEKLMAALYKDHPYRWTPIGRIPHLRAAEVQELRDFWQRYYVPNNATLVVAGDIKHAEVQQLARRHFGWIPRGEEPPRVEITDPMPNKARELKIDEDNAPAPIVGIVFRTAPLNDADTVPLELLSIILVGDDSSRLYRKMVAEEKLAVQTINVSNTLEQDGMFAAAAVLSPFGSNMAAARETLEAEVARLRTEEVTDHELEKAKNQMMKQTVVANLTVQGKASVLGRTAVLEGDAERANQMLETIKNTTTADLLRVAKEYFAPERALVISVDSNNAAGFSADKKKEEDAPITAKEEKVAPPPGRPGVSRPQGALVSPPIAPPLQADLKLDYVERTLSNGLKVYVVTNREQPFVSVQLGLLAGAWTESKPGTAAMTLGMLTKGTEGHTEAELADELGTYAISLEGDGGMDNSSVAATCLTEQLPRAVDLMAEVVLTPTFPQDEFEKHRGQVRADLAVAAGQPDYLAERELQRRLYGEHPYARTATGEVEDVDALAVSDLSQWWHEFARPDMAVLIFAGDVDADKAVALAEKAFADWKAEGPKPDVLLPAIPDASATHIYLIDRRAATQSQIRVGQLGITRDDPRYATGRVVSSYFGGAFNSRLNETIRVKKGLTYGARGGFSPSRLAGEFEISTFSKTESTAETVAAVFDELERLRKEAPDDDELKNTVSYMLGSFALGRETPQQVARDLWTIHANDLADDYFQQELESVSEATADGCLELAKNAVDPKRMVVVVVGKASELEDDLKKIAPVTVIKRRATRNARPG